MENEDKRETRHTDFGILYPFGYIVAAFPNEQDAQRVRADLLTGGYDAADCTVETSAEMVVEASRNLENNPGWLARLGTSGEMLQLHLDAANKGATFLRILAPSESDAERAMNVVRRVPFELAHRYRRWAIQEMK